MQKSSGAVLLPAHLLPAMLYFPSGHSTHVSPAGLNTVRSKENPAGHSATRHSTLVLPNNVSATFVQLLAARFFKNLLSLHLPPLGQL
jgi:hypothetical protein